MINSSDNYDREWLVLNHRDHTGIPFELYRPFAEQDTIDNNAKLVLLFQKEI